MNKRLWVKIMILIIIQAFMLTQGDFSIAASMSNKTSQFKNTLKLDQIRTKINSLISKFNFETSVFNNLNFSSLCLDSIFGFLISDLAISGLIISKGKVCVISKSFYKVFTVLNKKFDLSSSSYALEDHEIIIRVALAKVLTQETTGPPLELIKELQLSKNRTV